MRRGMLLLFVTAVSALVLGCAADKSLVLDKQTLSADTTWAGTIIVKGDIVVPVGVTLTVLPGTVVRFERIDKDSPGNMFGTDSPWYPEAEIIVYGRIVAQGTPEKNIVFTSNMRDARPADWGAINLLGSRDSVIQHCKIYCAYNGVHGHSSTSVVTNNEFAKNGVAISFKREDAPDGSYSGEARMVILNNKIRNNKGGINLRRASAVIAYNDISDNGFFGIWVNETSDAQIRYNTITGNVKGLYFYDVPRTRVSFNNIHDNKEYNIALAEMQTSDIDASDNFWGNVNAAKIAETIFDKRRDPEIASVKFEPLLRRPLEGAGAR